MIAGNKSIFALFAEPVSYISSMKDYDCFCGFYMKGKKYESNTTQMFYTQKESILNGALCNIVDSSIFFNMNLNECFIEMVKIRYLNFIAESKKEYLKKDWVDITNELKFSSNLESSIFGNNKYDLFCIGNEDKIRLIAYKIPDSYFSLKKLYQYNLNECYLDKKDLKETIYCFDEKFLKV